MLSNFDQMTVYSHLSPMQLWNTRLEYKLFDLNVVKGWIYQEIRLAKFFNWCKMKCQQKGKCTEPARKRNYIFDAPPCTLY